MSKFLSELEVEPVDMNNDVGKWRLMSDLVYQSDVANQTITVPKGFVTDFASVPRLPVAFALFGDTSHEAATVHDWLYTSHIVPRNVADAVLREASQVSGVPAWRRWPMWAGVRLFGGSHW